MIKRFSNLGNIKWLWCRITHRCPDCNKPLIFLSVRGDEHGHYYNVFRCVKCNNIWDEGEEYDLQENKS